MKHLIILLSLLSVAPALVSQAKYQVPGAGQISVRYGMPMYRDALVEQARPGLDWRLGANAPTVMETAAALVLNEGVVFPGTYTLTARCREETMWELRFAEGVQQGQASRDRTGPALPSLPLPRTRMEKEQEHTKKLSIEVQRAGDRDLAKLGGANFQVRFGPYQLANDFLCVGTVKKSHRIGKTAFELESLKLPLLPGFEAALLGKGEGPVTVARMMLANGSPPAVLKIEAAEEPTLAFDGWNRTVKGRRTEGLSKVNTMSVQLKASVLSIKLGSTLVEFDLEEDHLRVAGTGGTTPDK